MTRRTIAHISDLHFGRTNPVVADALVEDLHRDPPDVLVNSGDFTQRARQGQYKAAADYIRRLPGPQINVPGNHDIPLYDIFRRFLAPLNRFRRWITADPFPTYRDDGLIVIGINTARSLTWKGGRISQEQISELDRKLSDVPESAHKVIVTHHPFIPPPGEEGAGVDLVGRAEAALEVLERHRVDLLLAGHLHHGYTGDVRSHYPSSGYAIIVAQAGTAISNRVRYEPNGYNRITIDEERMCIGVRYWDGETFTAGEQTLYRKRDGLWRPDASQDSGSTPQ